MSLSENSTGLYANKRFKCTYEIGLITEDRFREEANTCDARHAEKKNVIAYKLGSRLLGYKSKTEANLLCILNIEYLINVRLKRRFRTY